MDLVEALQGSPSLESEPRQVIEDWHAQAVALGAPLGTDAESKIQSLLHLLVLASSVLATDRRAVVSSVGAKRQLLILLLPDFVG